jgi:hypothetical protein
LYDEIDEARENPARPSASLVAAPCLNDASKSVRLDIVDTAYIISSHPIILLRSISMIRKTSDCFLSVFRAEAPLSGRPFSSLEADFETNSQFLRERERERIYMNKGWAMMGAGLVRLAPAQQPARVVATPS